MLVLPQNVQSEHGALQGSWPGVSRRREDGREVGGVSAAERREVEDRRWSGRSWAAGAGAAGPAGPRDAPGSQRSRCSAPNGSALAAFSEPFAAFRGACMMILCKVNLSFCIYVAPEICAEDGFGFLF